MKNRLIVILIGAALTALSGSAAAHDRVSFGLSIGVPSPVYLAPPVAYYPVPPVYYAPPGYYMPPGYYAQAPWGFAAGFHSGYGYHRDWHGRH